MGALDKLWLPSLTVPRGSSLPVAGAVAWFDASQITGQGDNSLLSSWTDLSGNGNTVTASGTARPTYWSTTSGELFNGLPTVQFGNGGSTTTQMSVAASASLSLSAITIFAVRGHGNNLSNNTTVVAQRGASPVHWYLQDNAGQWNGSTHVGPGWVDGSGPDTISFQQNTSNFSAWRNGTAAGGNPYSVAIGTTGADTFSIGGDAGGSGNALAANIGEIVVYPSVLNTTDRQTVESYLRTKWGTP